MNLRILDIHVEGGDTQAGLKGFKKNKYFESAKFISKKSFFDLELVLIFSKRNLNILSVRTNFSIPKKSAIKIFNFSKNFIILKELISVIFKYK